MNKAKNAADPEETPDVVPDHPLTGKAAEEDYQKQLALLEEQNKIRLEKARESQSSNSSTQNTDRRT
ncbi:camp-dependent kinase pathway [Fusarium pseudocircinatum]|uniref:Camp-dependent kinase pathway n=1 Tax=Fusarium pseudocircinatum TaxID=56676 RepID=A0A8H5PMV1_9HYPO|nr:camp-dependent kinase pathway [Fusarium pseudocircinatum]